ncbi:MAG: FCSD flavin-binding domain-containing protein [Proteobacteria bacterium]|nr:FCSD flavin-binding domain-containing protein [Pseudomonadota bacterium]
MCYSGAATDPLESISVDAHYKYDPKTKCFSFDKVKLYKKWSADRGQQNLGWARALYREMFS